MHGTGWTFVRLTPDNRLQLDRIRKHGATTRDRLVNSIIRDFLETVRGHPHPPRRGRRRAA